MKTSSSLLQDVMEAIDSFFSAQKGLFFNESDLQLRLAIHLQNVLGEDTQVAPEYYVPTQELCGQPDLQSGHKKSIYIDIVVSRNGQYVPIELKYKTKSIQGHQLFRFGEPMGKSSLLQNHGAHRDNKILFWKDVDRLRQLRKRFHDAIPGGIFVLLTNDEYYPRDFNRQKLISVNDQNGGMDLDSSIASFTWTPNAIKAEDTPFNLLNIVII